MIYWTLFVITTSLSEPMDKNYTMISRHNDRWGCEVSLSEFKEIYHGDLGRCYLEVPSFELVQRRCAQMETQSRDLFA